LHTFRKKATKPFTKKRKKLCDEACLAHHCSTPSSSPVITLFDVITNSLRKKGKEINQEKKRGEERNDKDS